MESHRKTLLEEVERFLADTGMGASYFGKKAVGNSELVLRLRDGGDVRTGTAAKVRRFIAAEMLARDMDAA